MSAPLTDGEFARYSRQLALPGVGPEGQLRLKSGSVVLVGAGGLGCPAALYLAAAGVGRIGLIDFDRVDRSNLQRQVLYTEADIGRRKVEAAADRLRALNPDIIIEPHPVRLSADNARDLLGRYDVILDGADNFSARYLANDAAALLRKPCVHGSVLRFLGQAAVFEAGNGPCYRCLFPAPPAGEAVPTCAEAGVLGVLPGLVGSIMAAEALKLLLGAADVLRGRFLQIDGLTMRFREMKVVRDPLCPLCGDRPTITELQEYSVCCNTPVTTTKGTGVMDAIEVEELKKLLDAKAPIVLVDVREPAEVAVSRIPGSKLIPLGELPARFGELDPAADIVVHCKAGGRSARACEFLLAQGCKRVRNVTGGMLAWAQRVDPTIRVG